MASALIMRFHLVKLRDSWQNMEARRCNSQNWFWGHRGKKMVGTSEDAYATARVAGVFMGRGSGHKYRVKWTNLSEELISEYGANN